MRKLTEADRDLVLKYVSKEPEYNIFIIGDIENHGFDNDYQEIFMHEENSQIDCMLLRYRNHFVPYSHHEGFNSKAVFDQIKSYEKICDINGKADIVEKLIPYFPDFKRKTDYLSRLSKVSRLNTCADIDVKRLDPSFAGAVIDLYNKVDEFKDGYEGRTEEAAQETKFAMERGDLVFGVTADGVLLSVATATARNSRSAMIIGVCTLPEERGKGYASAVVSKLCESCLEEGMEFLCLFYDNPAAGRIYRRLGFAEMGRYMMLQNPRLN